MSKMGARVVHSRHASLDPPRAAGRFRARAVARLLLAVAGLTAGARSSAALPVADPRCEGLREAPQGGSNAAALRWGEHLLRQPVGWYSSRQASALADSVLRYQTPQGGWPKNTDLAALPGSPADVPPPGDGRANTIDNGATTLPRMSAAATAASRTG